MDDVSYFVQQTNRPARTSVMLKQKKKNLKVINDVFEFMVKRVGEGHFEIVCKL